MMHGPINIKMLLRYYGWEAWSKDPIGRCRLTLEECIIVDIKGIRWEGVNWNIVLRIGTSGGPL